MDPGNCFVAVEVLLVECVAGVGEDYRFHDGVHVAVGEELGDALVAVAQLRVRTGAFTTTPTTRTRAAYPSIRAAA